MAAEYDHITLPAGSMVTIANHKGEYIASGTLLEEYTITFRSEFGQLIDSGANDAFTVLGGALKTMTSGKFGFSSQFKQAGFVIWKGTDPIQLQFSLEFHYTYDAHKEVVVPIRNLCQLPLPGLGFGNSNLVPPGPSVIEAIAGPSAPNVPPSGEAPPSAEIDQESTKRTADTYVNIQVGNMLFMGCIIKTAEPTFSKYVDEGNSPIYGRVVITAITMHSATKKSVRNALKMPL